MSGKAGHSRYLDAAEEVATPTTQCPLQPLSFKLNLQGCSTTSLVSLGSGTVITEMVHVNKEGLGHSPKRITMYVWLSVSVA
jgi:hypothetical protein